MHVVQAIEGIERGSGNAVVADWKSAHEELVRLAADQARLEWEVGSSLLRALRSAAHLRLGYASFAEYVNRLFGFEPRFTSEKLRVAETLAELPELSRALRQGELSWSVVREVTRVATPASEAEWLGVARGKTSRDVERMVSGRRPGDRPDDPADAALMRHVLRFEVRAETRALLREALAMLRREAGGHLDDDAALMLMARRVLGGPTDAGRSSYQVVLTVCDECRRGWQHASGELAEVEPEVVEKAECDAQHIEMTHTGPRAGAGETQSPAPTHTGQPESAGAPQRATQSIPPAIRRLVMRRDAGRCQVPGCRHAQFVDVHHIRPRADGGNHDPDGLMLLCGAHHDAVHRGTLIVEGSVSGGIRFCHADGTSYGGPVVPRAADARTKAFWALRNLGFREADVKRALERVMTHVGAAPSIEDVLRKALAVLT